jgi:hypothetical protein
MSAYFSLAHARKHTGNPHTHSLVCLCSHCMSDCWEVYAGADTFTTTQQMMLENKMLPVCPATTAARARIVPDRVDYNASRMRR